MIKKIEKIENLIQKHLPEKPQKLLINRGRNPNHVCSEIITEKLMYLIRVTFIMIICINIYLVLYLEFLYHFFMILMTLL